MSFIEMLKKNKEMAMDNKRLSEISNELSGYLDTLETINLKVKKQGGATQKDVEDLYVIAIQTIACKKVVEEIKKRRESA